MAEDALQVLYGVAEIILGFAKQSFTRDAQGPAYLVHGRRLDGVAQPLDLIQPGKVFLQQQAGQVFFDQEEACLNSGAGK